MCIRDRYLALENWAKKNNTFKMEAKFISNVDQMCIRDRFSNVIIILVITLVMKFLLDWYMSTKSVYLLRAVGDNETIVTSMGVDKGITTLAPDCMPFSLPSGWICLLYTSRSN